MDLSCPKGMRDFLPLEASRREWIADTLKGVFKNYGFVPLETPVAERFEVLSSKFAGGEEILKETYRFSDQGKRELGLRYDLTVPLARVFAANPQLPRPFKRYQIAPVFRDGPLKKGRYREFVQCDVDTLGVASVLAEAELLALASQAFVALGLPVVLKVNNRKLLNGLLEDAKVPKEKQAGVLLSLDKLEKIGTAAVLAELEKERSVSVATGKKLLALFEKVGTGPKALTTLGKTMKSAEGKEGLQELQQLFDFLEAFSVQNAEFIPSLSRGLNYYTGTVYEAFLASDASSTISSSLAAGGRYDKLIGDFSGKNEPVPAVGISFGLDVIGEALIEKEQGRSSGISGAASVFVVPVGSTQKECVKVSQQLRAAGLQVVMDLAGRGLSKNLQWASKLGFKYALIIGEAEVKTGKYTLRDLNAGMEKKLTLNQLEAALRS